VVASIDSTIVRVRQHGATLPRLTRGPVELHGGRPPAFDSDAYKGRNVVERGFNQLKNWRGLAMRSDKTARNYLAASLVWLKATFSNTP
jgi:transposase